MRSSLCLILLLCGCSKPNVRCDAHLTPINASLVSANAAPVAVAAKAGATATATASATEAATASAVVSASDSASGRRSP
jgi:type IV secretory pathway TrbL component